MKAAFRMFSGASGVVIAHLIRVDGLVPYALANHVYYLLGGLPVTFTP